MCINNAECYSILCMVQYKSIAKPDLGCFLYMTEWVTTSAGTTGYSKHLWPQQHFPFTPAGSGGVGSPDEVRSPVGSPPC